MRNRPVACTVLSLAAVLALALPSAAQSLGELAQQERERRKAEEGTAPVPSYSDADLPAAPEGPEAQEAEEEAEEPQPAVEPEAPAPEQAPEAEPASLEEEAAERARAEVAWRQRAAAARREVEAAERALADANAEVERARAALEHAEQGGTVLQPGFLPAGTPVAPSTDSRVRADVAAARTRLAEAQAAADRARSNLAAAKTAWDELEDEARRAGALPGWLR